MTNAGAGVLILLLAACGGSPSYEQPAAAPAMSPAAQVGERIFSDTSLSGSRGQACSICHDPANAHAPGNALAAQLGGPNRNLQGVRQAPGIRYLRFNTAFFFDSEGTPTGGFFWDGRASSLQVQAAEPFLNPFEMAMPSKAAVVQRLSQATYATEFRSVFGSNIFADVDLAYDRMTFALAQYQKEDAEFAEFSSKYDAFLRGQATLAAQELRGLALFNDPNKGNCAACHPSAKGADGSLPLFTDFTYDNLGVPRNPDLQANADPTYFDLGLCARPDGSLSTRTDLCGAFKVPSLRNVGLRHTFFHNGQFKTLKDALTFYVQRDTNPEKFYPTVGGVVQKFNDLPPQYHPNVNRTEAPYNRNPGDVPALTDAEIDDLVVFLNTLSDGFVP
ncbi:MAG TPA: cytochrome c peroxidase [Burkholderiaceae bacterium]|nr:cytochrome c peroxidase [Burkholderiaceae bacterium]